MATTLAATEQRAHTPLGLALLGLAGALLAVLAIGWYGAAAGYVHAERLDHPTALTLAAGAAATVGLGLLLRGAVRTVVVLIGLGATTLGCAGLFALVSVFSASTWDDAAVVVTSPDGSLTTRVLLDGIVDPIYRVQVQQTDHGLLSRVVELGCINGESHRLQSLRWEGDELVAETSAGSIAITVPDPDSDRPVAWREVPGATLDEGAVTLEEC